MTDANFARALHAHCVAHAARTALIFDGRSTTYRDLAASVAGCARSLEERGLQPGAAVATVLPNSPAFVATYFAVLHLGGVIVPLGVLLRPREIQSRIALAGAALLVTTPELRGSLEPAAADAGAVVLAMQPDGSDIRPSDVLAPARREPHDVAALAFTSGSTGAPRAAEITHAGLAWNAEALGTRSS